jgi:HAD superfamily hydrolase (TIGR01450 family)
VTALVTAYDLVLFDLDGVLILGTEPVPGAPAAVAKLRDLGIPLAYGTNNASRRAVEVAELLTSIGIPAGPEEVVTSAQAAAALLAQRYQAGSPVLVVGAPALAQDVRDAGLRVVTSADDKPVAVVQGYGPVVGWPDLAEACLAIRAGAAWVATNVDRTLPSPRGPLPGNGSLVAALATALDRQPDVVVGKPDPGLFQQAARNRGAQRPLVVGDRLDTDIEGANRAGMDSMLVLTGVSQRADLDEAPPERRPTYVADDLSALFTRTKERIADSRAASEA